MSFKLKPVKEEFKVFAESFGLDKIDKDTAQYFETKRAFYCGMMCAINKLLVEVKVIVNNNEIEPEVENLVKSILKELEV
jgi:hypothetical protein